MDFKFSRKRPADAVADPPSVPPDTTQTIAAGGHSFAMTWETDTPHVTIDAHRRSWGPETGALRKSLRESSERDRVFGGSAIERYGPTGLAPSADQGMRSALSCVARGSE